MADPGPMDPDDVSNLVYAAARGDQTAWDKLVERFSGLVWSVTRSVGLSSEAAADVFHTTWLLLVERIGQINDPGRIGDWLAATARREALRSRREKPEGNS